VATIFAGVGGVAFSGAKAAALPSYPVSIMAATPCSKPKLLGIFVPWYQYLPLQTDNNGSCTVKDFTLLGNGSDSDVPLVLLAIVDDLLRLAGLVAVIFVIYGAVQYTTSQGSPDATAKAQSTVLYALIGLVIALVAIAFVTYLGKALT
jgi:hypothetical protein